MELSVGVENDCRLLKLSDDFCTYKPVGYLIKGTIYIANKSWGLLFSSVVRHYLYKDIVSFKTIIDDGVFKRTVGCNVEEVIQTTSKGLKGALNLGHGIYIATKGLKGEDVAYYLGKLIDAMGLDERELRIIVSKKNNELSREDIREFLLNSNTEDKSKDTNSDVEESKEGVGITNSKVDNKNNDIKVPFLDSNLTFSELRISFEDVDVCATTVANGVLCLNILSTETIKSKVVPLDVATDWRYYKPLEYSFRGSEFKDVCSWDSLYLDVLRSYTINTRDSDRFQALVDRGVFISYDYSLISNSFVPSMRNRCPIGRGMYADNCFYNPNDMKNMLLVLFSELGESFDSLQIKVEKLNK